MKFTQITDEVKNCNGCSACVVGCKTMCLKMEENEQGFKYPVINENGCNKCNNCLLYCPLYNPVELPMFESFYEYNGEYYRRDMPKVYRETIRQAKTGEPTEFVGTLCQIAGLKSLMGDKLRENLIIYPVFCDIENPMRPECEDCIFWKKVYENVESESK